MSDLISDILNAPVDSPLIMGLSIAYAIVESIRIYDARLIQAKTRGFVSGVAAEAEGRMLPTWVGSIHFVGWVLLIAIVILNWKYAIALYAILFVLRVLPVLERIGALIMSSFLRADPFNGYDFLEKGRARYIEKRFEDALANLDRAIECGICDDAYVMRADCLQALDFHHEAIEDYDRAISLEPEDCNLHFARSLSKNALCDNEGALKDLQKAIELSKADNELNNSYSAAAMENGWSGHTALYESRLINVALEKNMSPELRQELRQRRLARNSKRRKK